MHSNLTGYGPEAAYTPLNTEDGDQTLGGFSRLAGYIDKQRQQNPDNLLVLDAGDFLMGTVFHTLENETGFQLSLMKLIGYDYVTLGNHEFAMGQNYNAKAINVAAK
jgi:5'-nucleotidase